MKRLMTLCALVFVAVSGCARVPAGVDRNLVDEWPKFAEAKLPVPQVGGCYDASDSSAGLVQRLNSPESLRLVKSCTEPHVSETFHVGLFTGAAADRPAPPIIEGDLTPPWNDCNVVSKDYLGDDWRVGRLHLVVLAPSPKHWSAGARWYRCELVVVTSEAGRILTRTQGVKDGLRGARPLAIACANMLGESGGSFEDLADTPCTSAHKAEFAGVAVTNVTEYPTTGDQSEKAFESACIGLAARYLNVTTAQYLRHQQFSVAWWSTNKTRWALGDRSASCYVTTTKPVSISVRGYGNRNLP
jgi:hypothetical protein